MRTSADSGRMRPGFGLVERYILRTLTVAFLATLVVLTLVIWITQALRELDLVTAKGQTLMVFLVITSLSIPALVTVIAPAALFIAVLFTLNKLNTDSELIVMSAAGMPPGLILKPFVVLSVAVSLLVGAMTLWALPASFKSLRLLVTQIRADVVANIVREGQFTTLEQGVTFHFRERAGDTLVGVFIQDARDRRRQIVYLAERGRTVDVDGSSFLVLEKGSVQRLTDNRKESNIVAFERYAIDLSQIASETGAILFKPRERSTWELLRPDPNDPVYKSQPGRFRAELHDRITSPLYPLVFTLIAFACLGSPRTTRQGRGLAVTAANLLVFAVRILGFAVTTAIPRSAALVPVVYIVPIGACVVALVAILRPEWLSPARWRVPLAMPRPVAAPRPGE